MRLVDPRHWDKMHVVRCGLPFDRLPSHSPREDEVRTIICVGRFSPEKGQTGLLRVLARLLTRHPHVRLRLIGDGPDGANLKALADELGVASSVTFAGRLPEDDALAEIAQSDLLVVPSFMEGLPIVLMEAMALGVPVVASGVAGIPELVEDGTTGLLFSPSNWNELEQQIERLMTDKTLRGSLAQRAKDKVTAEFDTRKSAAELSRLFQDVHKSNVAAR